MELRGGMESFEPGSGSLASPFASDVPTYVTSLLGTTEGTPSAAGSNDFLADVDDTIFQSWELTDAVDTCFGNNLDPGCPFTWPEYASEYRSNGYYVF